LVGVGGLILPTFGGYLAGGGGGSRS
jgi:hypothetical protein